MLWRFYCCRSIVFCSSFSSFVFRLTLPSFLCFIIYLFIYYYFCFCLRVSVWSFVYILNMHSVRTSECVSVGVHVQDMVFVLSVPFTFFTQPFYFSLSPSLPFSFPLSPPPPYSFHFPPSPLSSSAPFLASRPWQCKPTKQWSNMCSWRNIARTIFLADARKHTPEPKLIVVN